MRSFIHNPVPLFFRMFNGWVSIQRQVNDWAKEKDYIPYSQEPRLYRFDGWGVVGIFRPRLACNVKFLPTPYRRRLGYDFQDLGRIVAR